MLRSQRLANGEPPHLQGISSRACHIRSPQSTFSPQSSRARRPQSSPTRHLQPSLRYSLPT